MIAKPGISGLEDRILLANWAMTFPARSDRLARVHHLHPLRETTARVADPNNLHLLSPQLRQLSIIDYVALGEKKDDGKTHYRLDDAEQVINIHRKFRAILGGEYNELLKK